MSDAETVYVAAGCDRYHEPRECQGLSHARAIDERSLPELADEYSLCELCAGTHRPDSADEPPVTATVLEDLDPEDVGSQLPDGSESPDRP